MTTSTYKFGGVLNKCKSMQPTGDDKGTNTGMLISVRVNVLFWTKSYHHWCSPILSRWYSRKWSDDLAHAECNGDSWYKSEFFLPPVGLYRVRGISLSCSLQIKAHLVTSMKLCVIASAPSFLKSQFYVPKVKALENHVKIATGTGWTEDPSTTTNGPVTSLQYLPTNVPGLEWHCQLLVVGMPSNVQFHILATVNIIQMVSRLSSTPTFKWRRWEGASQAGGATPVIVTS